MNLEIYYRQEHFRKPIYKITHNNRTVYSLSVNNIIIYIKEEIIPLDDDYTKIVLCFSKITKSRIFNFNTLDDIIKQLVEELI